MLPASSVVVLVLSRLLPRNGPAGRRFSASCTAFIIVVLTCTTLNAQTIPAIFRGRVLDSTGAVISNARITTASDGLAGPSVNSGRGGEFAIPLIPGYYTVNVSANGFSQVSRVIDVRAGMNEATEFVLPIAKASTTVSVEADGYRAQATATATRTPTMLSDIPQSISVVSQAQIKDQLMMSIADVVQYVPGITSHQGENNRDQLVIRGNSTSADFFLDGVRDDVQYYRDLYNAERIEALKGPNAMTFGRGGGGGVVNRVTKEAGFAPLHEFSLIGGSFGEKRITADLDQPVDHKTALRLNGMYEDDNSFRHFVGLTRYGINPTLAIAPSSDTSINLGYEFLHDRRVADRGIPSYQGLPLDTDISTYFGNPNNSHVFAHVHLGSISLSHRFGRWNFLGHTLIGDYDRGYQNYVPGAIDAAKSVDSLSAYNNATARRNLFNQATVTTNVTTGRFHHLFMGGMELGRQLTDNFRNTGFFSNTATAISIPLNNTVIFTPVTFRQSATDANNRLETNLAAVFLQDQLEFTSRLQLIAGLRFDYFDLQYHDNRSNADLRRIDNLISPRAGLVFKPVPSVSVYTSFAISYLPSSGDQFSSLTNITQQVKPEKFNNYEIGAKWDVRPDLSLTTAVYRLDRINTRSTDPNDPTRIVQTGSTRNNGFELGWNGRVLRSWRVAGGYAHQDSYISRATTSALSGAQVALVPHHTFSLWNNYRFVPRVGAGLGVIHRTDMFAAVDNAVVLPGYTRIDVAAFVTLRENLELQANVENLAGAKYYLTADGNNNISPGSSRAVRVALRARF